MSRVLFWGAGVLGAVLSGSGMPNRAPVARVPTRSPSSVLQSVQLETLAAGLGGITAITSAGDGRVFLTLQAGTIAIWDGIHVLPVPFLDLSAKISCCGERGLLSTAFHPSYAGNGLFFVDYTNLNGDTVIERYRVSSDPNRADPFSAATVLTVPQPFENHNGGQLQFGPDGFLYIGMGDGGSGNDPFCNAQSPTSLLGKLLRIDVDRQADSPPFHAIPSDNPFLGTPDGPPEAWAKGLRNPWRFSFDRVTGDLIIGDVGQDEREEVDFQPAASAGGQNYGWKVMEGTRCGDGGASGCLMPVPPCGDPGYTLPVLEYTHDGGNCSITGGYVYRGLSTPELYGSYVFGDYCSGTIWAGTVGPGTWAITLLPVILPNLTTFGEDVFGELYLGTQDGGLYRFAPTAAPTPTIAAVSPEAVLANRGARVTITGQNFTRETQVFFGSVPVAAAAVEVASPFTLVAAAPPGPAGTVDVTVVNTGAPPATLAAALTYTPMNRVAPPGGTRFVIR